MNGWFLLGALITTAGGILPLSDRWRVGALELTAIFYTAGIVSVLA